VFDIVREKLRDDATLWVNLGDSYSGSGKGPTGHNGLQNAETRQGFTSGYLRENGEWSKGGRKSKTEGVGGIPAKNLLLIPQRFAIAMQDAGWIVRSCIAWTKTSAMPESVRDRPTSAWEPIWMFAKSRNYFFDQEAVRVPWADDRQGGSGTKTLRYSEQSGRNGDSGLGPSPGYSGANLRNVWSLSPEPSREQHYAAFPSEIPRRCIKAATSERGACPACGAGWVRVVERAKGQENVAPKLSRLAETGASTNGTGGSTLGLSGHAGAGWRERGSTSETTGWQPSCSCKDAGPPIPQTILDPFLGSGTTALVADQLGRDCIGIELNPEYVTLARNRIERSAPLLTADAVTVQRHEQAALFTEEAV
jgi:DNA modification methylase